MASAKALLRRLLALAVTVTSQCHQNDESWYVEHCRRCGAIETDAARLRGASYVRAPDTDMLLEIQRLIQTPFVLGEAADDSRVTARAAGDSVEQGRWADDCGLEGPGALWWSFRSPPPFGTAFVLDSLFD